MPFDGSGFFHRLYSWVDDATNGIKINAPRMDADTDAIATALGNCMTRDGQSPALADIPMGGKKLVNLANGTAPTDAATVGQLPSPIAKAASSAAANTAQSGLGTTPVKVAFNAVVFDMLGEWSGVLARFTAQNVGVYMVSACVIMRAAGGPGTVNGLAIYRNGVAVYGLGYMAAAANIDTVVPIVGIVTLNVGDYIEIFADFGTGTTNVLQNTAGIGDFSQISVWRIG